MDGETPSAERPPRRFRKLRIAWSVACAIACLLLITMWVRSYSTSDLLYSFGTNGWMLGIGSEAGMSSVIYAPISTPPTAGMVPRSWSLQTTKTINSGMRIGLTLSKGVVYFALPYWALVPVIATVAMMPWLRFRFGLRFMLIATTLIALVLGLAVYEGR